MNIDDTNDMLSKYEEACEYLRARGLYPFPLQNGIKNTAPTPKYDPNRKFKEGDVVRYKPCNGRDCKSFPDDEFFRERTLTVIASEDYTSHNVMVISQDGRTRVVEFCYLELVTPVEALEPYSVGGCIDGCILYKNGEHYAEFVNSIDAERACKLLNAEYRKEQSND